MNIRNFGRGMSFSRIALAAVSAIAFFGIAGVQEREKTGKVQQGLSVARWSVPRSRSNMDC